jgi:23S rRNA (guanosine2251-2'-O)-methyltransferase
MTRRDPSRGESELVVFGRNAVQEAIDSDGAEVLAVAVARGIPPELRRSLGQRTREIGCSFEELSRESLTRWTRASRHDQGVAARVRLLGLMEVDAFVASLTGVAAREPARVLALDGVTNSQNVGMVVRSVVAAGLDGLLWPMAGQPWINGLVVRAAAGAIFECPIIRCNTLAEGMALLQGAGFAAFGLDGGASRSLFELAPPHRSLFVLGNESEGVSGPIREALDECLAIPMAGPVESLNVAVAAGLVSFHATGILGTAAHGRDPSHRRD